MTFWKWSKTPGDNGTADNSCPWPEGMAPSQVNDSARGQMAALAKYRDDISGKLLTTGTSTAYVISSNQSFDTAAHLDGAMIAFIPHVDSGAAPTLNVDGTGATAVRGRTGVNLPARALRAGSPYVVYYSQSTSEFLLHSYQIDPEEVIPIGAGIEYWGTTVPSDNFVFLYGQAISRTDYPVCFSRLGTTYGSGNGSTTFNLPDKRGRVSAGKDDMGGSAASRLTSAGAVTGTTLGYGGGSQFHSLTADQGPQHSHTASTTNSSSTFTLTFTPSYYSVIDQTNVIGIQTASVANVLRPTGTNTPTVTIPAGALSLSTTVNNAGSSDPHNNVQPTIICNYIMRVK